MTEREKKKIIRELKEKSIGDLSRDEFLFLYRDKKTEKSKVDLLLDYTNALVEAGKVNPLRFFYSHRQDIDLTALSLFLYIEGEGASLSYNNLKKLVGFKSSHKTKEELENEFDPFLDSMAAYINFVKNIDGENIRIHINSINKKPCINMLSRTKNKVKNTEYMLYIMVNYLYPLIKETKRYDVVFYRSQLFKYFGFIKEEYLYPLIYADDVKDDDDKEDGKVESRTKKRKRKRKAASKNERIDMTMQKYIDDILDGYKKEGYTNEESKEKIKEAYNDMLNITNFTFKNLLNSLFDTCVRYGILSKWESVDSAIKYDVQLDKYIPMALTEDEEKCLFIDIYDVVKKVFNKKNLESMRDEISSSEELTIKFNQIYIIIFSNEFNVEPYRGYRLIFNADNIDAINFVAENDLMKNLTNDEAKERMNEKSLTLVNSSREQIYKSRMIKNLGDDGDNIDGIYTPEQEEERSVIRKKIIEQDLLCDVLVNSFCNMKFIGDIPVRYKDFIELEEFITSGSKACEKPKDVKYSLDDIDRIMNMSLLELQENYNAFYIRNTNIAIARLNKLIELQKKYKNEGLTIVDVRNQVKENKRKVEKQIN